jgi:hypothetical protein
VSQYILTEHLGGDYANHLAVQGVYPTKKKASDRRTEIIVNRTTRPLFNEFNQNDPKDVARYLKDLQQTLRVWRLVI